MAGNKQYGLLIPKKFNITEVKRPSAFNNDSDSDNDGKEVGSSDWIKKSFQKQSAQSSGVRRQTEIDMKRALDEDPDVYKYDEIYDQIEKKKTEEEQKKKDDKKKPRYIQSLLRKAEQRKLENERRIEKQVQKEREAEGEQFKDKETFVTSSYKKKLEEFNKMDEEERKQEMLEDICDVSKQQDLGGFYRHLYKTTVDKETTEIKKEPQVLVKQDKIIVKHPEELNTDKKPLREKRQYRKRKSSESSSLEEGEHDTSDTSSSSSSASSSSESSSSGTKSLTKRSKQQVKVEDEVQVSSNKIKQEVEPSEIEKPSKNSSEVVADKKDKANEKSDKNTKETSPPPPSKDVKEPIKIKDDKPKINIWVKRTVGSVFDAALKRYFERKAERLAGRGN